MLQLIRFIEQHVSDGEIGRTRAASICACVRKWIVPNDVRTALCFDASQDSRGESRIIAAHGVASTRSVGSSMNVLMSMFQLWTYKEQLNWLSTMDIQLSVQD